MTAFLLVGLDGLLIALPALRFILFGFSQQHLLVVLDGAVGERGELAAFHTDGMYFGNFVCNGTQSRHRAEWNTAEVHIQSGYNDAYTIVGKLVAYINQATVKELGFVNAHYIYL